jgi:hypothetical protein
MKVIRRKVFLIAAGILAIAFVPADLSARGTSIALIVNPRNSTETISLAERRYCAGSHI